MTIQQLVLPSIEAALQAGKSIMDVYETDFSVERKEDNSPLTLADKQSHDTILSALEKYSFPILSEEGKEIPYSTRKNWGQYWLIDPLDGTKEFVKRNGEFTVNIALVKNSSPVLGVIYAPVKKLFYFAAEGLGAFRYKINNPATDAASILLQAKKLPLQFQRKNFTVVASRSHLSSETAEYIKHMKEKHGEVDCVSSGSSIKICLVADGSADVYPRFGPTMEWDTAAGQAITEQAGKQLVDYTTKKNMVYNKESLRNNWFIVE